MNTVTRAHFHLRIQALLKDAPVVSSVTWSAAAADLLRELFPLLEPCTEPVHPAATLRERAAIAAMQSLIATPLSEWPIVQETGKAHSGSVIETATWVADGLVAALNKEKPQ